MKSNKFSHLNTHKVAKALSLTGGGVRGIYTASVLANIEGHFKVEIQDCFDLFCGTSIGGIISIGLAAGISASDIAQKMADSASNIFREPAWFNPKGLRKVRYSSSALRCAIEEILGEKSEMFLSELQSDVLVMSVNASENRIEYFSNRPKFGNTRTKNAKLIDVAMATSAAPTYFSPHRIENDLFIDGGMVSNNPDLEAFHFCSSELGRSIDAIKILSIGTGNPVLQIPSNIKLDFGTAAWMAEYGLLDRLMSLQEAKASGYISDLLGGSYLRLDTLFSQKIELDDASANTKLKLTRFAAETVRSQIETDLGALAMMIH